MLRASLVACVTGSGRREPDLFAIRETGFRGNRNGEPCENLEPPYGSGARRQLLKPPLLPYEESQPAGQMPETVKRDLEIANAQFSAAKLAYETFCERTGQQAYAVYNDD